MSHLPRQLVYISQGFLYHLFNVTTVSLLHHPAALPLHSKIQALFDGEDRCLCRAQHEQKGDDLDCVGTPDLEHRYSILMEEMLLFENHRSASLIEIIITTAT